MARTMTVEGSKLIIQLRPFESLTGLADFKTHVKTVTIHETASCHWFPVEVELDECNMVKWLYFPHGSVAVYKERPA